MLVIEAAPLAQTCAGSRVLEGGEEFTRRTQGGFDQTDGRRTAEQTPRER